MTIVATTADGKRVFRGKSDSISVAAGADQSVSIRVTEARRVLEVLNVRLSLDPVVTATPCNYTIGGTPADLNVVGLTCRCEAATTLVVEVDVLGI